MSTPRVPRSPRTSRARNRFNDQTAAGWLLAGPAMLGLGLFILLPFLVALAMAFTNLRLGSPLPLEFVGIKQFQRLLEDPDFLRALVNNLLFAVMVVPLQTALALGLALLLNRGLRGTVLFRTLFFMPVVFPMSLVAVVWVLIYAPGPNGMMNGFLEFITLGAWEPRDFLRDPALAMPALVLLSVWQGAGFQMVNSRQIGRGIPITGLSFGPDGALYATDWDGGYPLTQTGAVWKIDVAAGEGDSRRTDTAEPTADCARGRSPHTARSATRG